MNNLSETSIKIYESLIKDSKLVDMVMDKILTIMKDEDKLHRFFERSGHSHSYAGHELNLNWRMCMPKFAQSLIGNVSTAYMEAFVTDSYSRPNKDQVLAFEIRYYTYKTLPSGRSKMSAKKLYDGNPDGGDYYKSFHIYVTEEMSVTTVHATK